MGKIFKFLSLLYGDAGKRLNKEAKVNFKIYDVMNWETGTIHVYNRM